MSTKPQRRRTTDEWTALIEAYLQSGLTQKAFCQQHGISFHSFRHRYQRSPLFRGKRRGQRAAGFQPILMARAPSTAADPWVVRCGDDVRIEFPAETPVDTLIRLVRGLADAT